MKSIFSKNDHIYAIAILIIIACYFQTVHADSEPSVSTDKHAYSYGETIIVNFSNAPGKDSDWICIVPSGSPNNEVGDYKHMPKGVARGVLHFDSPSPGEYEVRAFYNYRQLGYVAAARYSFLVNSTSKYEKEDTLRKANYSSYKEGVIKQVFDASGYSKEQIFNGAKIWISENFRSAKAVLEYENKEAGTIIGNGNIPFPCQGFQCIGTGGWKVSFTMRADIKDQKFRLTFTNLRVFGTDRGLYDGPIGRESSFNNVKDALSGFGREIVASLKKEQSKDDW